LDGFVQVSGVVEYANDRRHLQAPNKAMVTYSVSFSALGRREYKIGITWSCRSRSGEDSADGGRTQGFNQGFHLDGFLFQFL